MGISIGFSASFYIYSSHLNNFRRCVVTYVNIIKMSAFIIFSSVHCSNLLHAVKASAFLFLKENWINFKSWGTEMNDWLA